MLPADDVASVILARSGPWMDAWTLQKLLYYTQAWHLAITDKPLFPEPIKAWRDGPVVPQVRAARQNKATRRAAAQQIEHIELDDLASNIIDLVLGTYGSMTGQELSALTHAEAPWKETRGDLPPEAECRTPITHESMASFYRSERLLEGRKAADLAAGGVHLRATAFQGPVAVDEILQSLGEQEYDDVDPWGGANLEDPRRYDHEGIEEGRRRAYAGD